MGCDQQRPAFEEIAFRFEVPQKRTQDMTPYNLFYNTLILPYLQQPGSPRRPPSIDENLLFDERVASFRPSALQDFTTRWAPLTLARAGPLLSNKSQSPLFTSFFPFSPYLTKRL